MAADPLGLDEVPLVPAQEAAAARLRDVVRRGGVAVLCGPAGTGKTLLLKRLAMQQEACHAKGLWGPAPLRQLSAELEAGTAGPFAAAGRSPRVVLVDDAHTAGESAELQRAVERVDRSGAAPVIVLAGEGRLLTLLARQPDLEQRVLFRAVLRTWSEGETAAVLARILPQLDTQAEGAALSSRLHELTAGVPRQLMRMLETVRMVLSAEPEHRLTVDDLETFHRRLFLQAA